MKAARLARACVLACTLASLACAHGSASDADARKALVEANLVELQDCWTELAAAHPGASGSLLFAVDIRRSGSVDYVSVAVDEIGSPKLVACSVRRIKRWKFPEGRRQTIEFGVGFTAPRVG